MRGVRLEGCLLSCTWWDDFALSTDGNTVSLEYPILHFHF